MLCKILGSWDKEGNAFFFCFLFIWYQKIEIGSRIIFRSCYILLQASQMQYEKTCNERVKCQYNKKRKVDVSMHGKRLKEIRYRRWQSRDFFVIENWWSGIKRAERGRLRGWGSSWFIYQNTQKGDAVYMRMQNFKVRRWMIRDDTK